MHFHKFRKVKNESEDGSEILTHSTECEWTAKENGLNNGDDEAANNSEDSSPSFKWFLSEDLTLTQLPRRYKPNHKLPSKATAGPAFYDKQGNQNNLCVIVKIEDMPMIQ